MGNGHVVQDEVEPQCSPLQIVAHETRHHFTLSDQLRRVELCHDRLEDLIDDGGENTLIIVCSELTIYFR